MKLTLHKAEGSVYDVEGLPSGENAKIAQFDNSWRVLRWNRDWHGNWTGNHSTLEAALAALHEEINLAAAS